MRLLFVLAGLFSLTIFGRADTHLPGKQVSPFIDERRGPVRKVTALEIFDAITVAVVQSPEVADYYRGIQKVADALTDREYRDLNFLYAKVDETSRKFRADPGVGEALRNLFFEKNVIRNAEVIAKYGWKVGKPKFDGLTAEFEASIGDKEVIVRFISNWMTFHVAKPVRVRVSVASLFPRGSVTTDGNSLTEWPDYVLDFCGFSDLAFVFNYSARIYQHMTLTLGPGTVSYKFDLLKYLKKADLPDKEIEEMAERRFPFSVKHL